MMIVLDDEADADCVSVNDEDSVWGTIESEGAAAQVVEVQPTV